MPHRSSFFSHSGPHHQRGPGHTFAGYGGHPPHHSHLQMEPRHMSNPIEIEADLVPTFGQHNSAILVRCVENVHPLEAGPKLMLEARALNNVISICIATNMDVDAATAWLKEPIDISHPRAMAYSIIYSSEGLSLFSKMLNEADAEHIRNRLTYGPMEMQANTIVQLALAYMVMKLSETSIVPPQETISEKTEKSS